MEGLMTDPKFTSKLKALAERNNMSYNEAQAEAKLCLKEIQTVHQPLANIIGLQVSQFILSRGYGHTIDVNPNEIKELSRIARRFPIAFVMTHKTYLDMFVLAVVLGRHGIPFPYTFAGINMDFIGFGQLARQNGVIFIRRSFKDNDIYKLVLRCFIATIVKDKGHFMWAIEGTRSRTGKLVWPKVGILKYIREAEEESGQEVKYIPVSIVYDLIPDVRDMTMESRGKDKNPESLTWFLKYVQKMEGNFGKISIRFGNPVPINAENSVAIIVKGKQASSFSGRLSKFGVELAYRINQVTPVTTTSLICIALLSKFSLNKKAIINDVYDLMGMIEKYKPGTMVDRGIPISRSVQTALMLLKRANIILQHGDEVDARYVINSENYLEAVYYANMSVHHLYSLAFIELALLKSAEAKPADRQVVFWAEIMELRSLFKFEFFYPRKLQFSEELEKTLGLLDRNWNKLVSASKARKIAFLRGEKVIVAPVVLYTYLEAYRIIVFALKQWKPERAFDEKAFIDECLFLGEELHWHGKIQRIRSVTKPYLIDGLKLITNLDLIPTADDDKKTEIQAFLNRLNETIERIKVLQEIIMEKPTVETSIVPMIEDNVPGSKTEAITSEILKGEKGAHIGAFFDLDRTLIRSYSAKEFFQTRLFSGKMSTTELVSQFAGVLVYSMGQGNYAGLAAIASQGVKGVEEKVFIKVGEEAYFKHLASEIYPESRALVKAHLAMGHTVAIISAATPYQVNPIARDLNIDHVLCTRMEVVNGKFTGKIMEPAAWGEGKAIAARMLAESRKLDMAKSFFYTDSVSDIPLLEAVGHPRPTNPDVKLTAHAFRNHWPIFRFNDEDPPGMVNFLRTGLALGSLIPAALSGIAKGAMSLNWQDGVNSLMASVGDFVIAAAGIQLLVTGEEHLWSHRPAVFIFNHQSSADIFIVSKLIRQNATGIAKIELKSMPIIGQLMTAAGVIFIDRSDREKAIEAMAPAVDALKNGTSIIIFPEGTRSKDYSLGTFKKGAFHLAMQAKAPIVPVVIRNAHDAMPRGTNVFRPSAIDVVVYPPVSTKKWTKDNMDKHIQNLRKIYLTELGQG